MLASLADLPLPILEYIIAEGQLSLANITCLLQLNHACHKLLTNRAFNVFLLKHFFPFASETYEHTHQRSHQGAGDYSQKDIPFPTLHSPPHREPREALVGLCTRLSRLRKRNWSAFWEFQFGEWENDENMPGQQSDLWFSDGFFLIDIEGGYLLTAATEDNKGEIILSVGRLDDRKTVRIVAPMDPFDVAREMRERSKSTIWRGRSVAMRTEHEQRKALKRPGIYLKCGKVLLIYDHPEKEESIFLLKDGSFDGRTLWTAVLKTKVFLGIEPDLHIEKQPLETDDFPMGHLYRRQLEPIFNEHYVAFVNTYAAPTALEPPEGILMVCRFVSHNPREPLECFATDYVVGSETLSFQTDSLGRVLLVASRIAPKSSNIYRVTMIDAGGEGDFVGGKLGDYDMPMARHFKPGKRDMEYQITQNNSQLIMYGSSHLDTFRQVVLGQISVYDIPSGSVHAGKPVRQRYFLTPALGNSTKYTCQPFNCRTSYDLELSVVTYTQRPKSSDPIESTEPRLVQYESLNLDVKSAGTGEITNGYNTRPSRWMTSIPATKEEKSSIHPTNGHLSASIVIGPGGSLTREKHLHTLCSKDWICILSARYTTDAISSITKMKKIIRLYSIGEANGADFSGSTSHAQTPSDFLHSRSGVSSSGGLDPDSYSAARSRSPLPAAVAAPFHVGSISPSPRLSIQEKDVAQQAAARHAQLLAKALEAERGRRERGEVDAKWERFGDFEEVEDALPQAQLIKKGPMNELGEKGGKKGWKKLLKFGR